MALKCPGMYRSARASRPVLDGKGAARPASLFIACVRDRYRMAETQGSVSRARGE